MDVVPAWKQETGFPFCPVLVSITFNCPWAESWNGYLDTSEGQQNRLIVRLLVRTHQGRLLSQSSLSEPLSVGIVLAQCPGETLEITETLSLSAMMMATLKLLGSPWPLWWVHCRCYQTWGMLWAALQRAKLSSFLENHQDSTYSAKAKTCSAVRF